MRIWQWFNKTANESINENEEILKATIDNELKNDQKIESNKINSKNNNLELNSIIIKNSKQNNNNQKDDYNLPKRRKRRIPKRFNSNKKKNYFRYSHRNHKFDKLSPSYSLPTTNNQMNDNEKLNSNLKSQNQIKYQKNEKNKNNQLINSPIKFIHRKVKRRKKIHNKNFLSRDKFKSKTNFNKFINRNEYKNKFRKFQNVTKNKFYSNQSNLLLQNNSLSNSLIPSLITTTLSSFITFDKFINQSTEQPTHLNDNHNKREVIQSPLNYYQNNLALSDNQFIECNNKRCFSSSNVLELKSLNEKRTRIKLNDNDNLYRTQLIKPSLTSLNQINKGEDEFSMRFAQNLMVIIYIIILFSVLVLLLRVIYIAILRKLRRPGQSANSQSQNSARHSSQLYTQNTFNQLHYSNLHPGGGANSNNSNINVSTYARSSEPNSIISGGTASFIGTLSNTLIAHNAQLNRNDDKTNNNNIGKKENNNNLLADDKVNIKKQQTTAINNNQFNRSDSPASLNIRPFSRNSGKFAEFNNIISDEFSSSVYVNENYDLNQSN